MVAEWQQLLLSLSLFLCVCQCLPESTRCPKCLSLSSFLPHLPFFPSLLFPQMVCAILDVLSVRLALLLQRRNSAAVVANVNDGGGGGYPPLLLC